LFIGSTPVSLRFKEKAAKVLRPWRPGVQNRYIENGTIVFKPKLWTCTIVTRPEDRVDDISDANL
jgi:hypothetical protein